MIQSYRGLWGRSYDSSSDSETEASNWYRLTALIEGLSALSSAKESGSSDGYQQSSLTSINSNLYYLISSMHQPHSNGTLVQTMRHTVSMRFRLEPTNLCFSQLTNTQSQQNREKELFELKFCQEVGQFHLIIGNQYQINLINLTGVTEDYPQVSSNWTLSFTDKITAVYIIRRIHKLFIVCDQIIYCYGYRDDSIQTAPILYQKLTLKSSIDSIYLPKKDHLLVFTGIKFTVFEMYNPHGIFQFKPITQKVYRSANSPKFVCIPQENDFAFSVFFSEYSGLQSKGAQDVTRSLWQPKMKLAIFSIRIIYNSANEVAIGNMQLFSEFHVVSRDIPSLNIGHYKEDIFLVQFGLSVLAVRHNYILDNISFHTPKISSSVRMLSNQHLLHFEKDKFDHYQYRLGERKPQTFQLQCLDSIPFKPPEGSTFFDVKQMGKRLVFVTQEVTWQRSQLRYWLIIGESTPKETKIKEMLPAKLQPEEELGSEAIDEKIQAACKIGFSKSEAYYQLWSRSAKTTKRNYELLIATEDYEIIREQLQKKFRTHSLSYHQVSLVLKSSLEMLNHKVRKNNPGKKTIKQYAMCHFLFCKVEMYQKMKRNLGQQNGDITISIQDYHYLNSIQLQSQLFQLLNQLLIDKKPVVVKVRALLNQFSLVFRLLYQQILPRIIQNFTDHLQDLLQAIPEILPVEIFTEDSQDIRNSLWKSFDLTDSAEYFILQHIRGLQTQASIEQFVRSNFFKVYQWNQHGTITGSLQALTKTLEIYNTDYIFTQFYAIIFMENQKIQNTRSSPGRKETVDLLVDKIIRLVESKYKLLPSRLKGKFTFYSELYRRFKNFYSIDRKSVIDVVQFFALSEADLFHLYFRKEREEKGIFILRQIKPVYQKSAKEGSLIFLRNMYEFFKSEQSSWSDLKIIFNKLNNQKQDFHLSNQSIIDVLIKAIMEKVYIGTGKPNELDLREVISYIENLPIEARDNELLRNVIAIREICQEQQLLKAIQINMNLKGIVERGEQVVFKMVDYEVQRLRVLDLESSREVRLYAYHIMFGINEKQMRIYLQKYLSFVFKSFLIILMQQERMIPLCKDIISDQYLLQQFKVTTELIENTVLYLYRQRLHQNPIYLSNKQYINLLLELLSPSSHKAKFIVLSEAFAKAFTFQHFHIRYPFFMSYYPTVRQVQQLVNSLSKEEVSIIDYKMLIEIIYMLKILGESYENIQSTRYYSYQRLNGKEKKAKLKLEVLIVFFIKFHREELFDRALEISQLILAVESPRQRVADIIFPLFLMQTLQKELLKRVQQPIVRLVSYYFHHPSSLLEIIIKLTTSNNVFSHEEIDQVIEQSLSLKRHELIYDPDNQVFSESFKEIIRGMCIEQQVRSMNPLMETVWQQIRERRQEFQSNHIYSIMFRILLQDPLTLAQYIYRHHQGINTRSLRALITLLAFQSIFDMESMILIGLSIFEVLLTKIDKYDTEDGQMFSSEDELKQKTKLSAQDLLRNSISIMKEKSRMLADNPQIQKKKQEKTREIMFIIQDRKGYLERKSEDSYLLLQRLYPYKCSPVRKKQILKEVLEKNNSLRYPFDDADLQYTEPKYDLLMPISLYQPQKVDFNEVSERSEVNNQLLYVKKPAYRQLDCRSRFQPSSIPEFEELYLNTFQSKVKRNNSSIYISKRRDNQACTKARDLYQKQHLRVEEQDDRAQLDAFFKRTCKAQGFLGILNRQIPQNGRSDDFNQVSFAIKDDQQRFSLNESSDLTRQIQSYLQSQRDFNFSALPHFQSQSQSKAFFQQLVHHIYNAQDKCLKKRIQLIWLTKEKLLGIDSVKQQARGLTERLARCEATKNIFASIQAIFPEFVFTDSFESSSILRTIQQNIDEHVYLLEDFCYIAEIVGEAFYSEQAQIQILRFALLKLIKKLNQCDTPQIRDQILTLLQRANSLGVEQSLVVQANQIGLDLSIFTQIAKELQAKQTQDHQFIV